MSWLWTQAGRCQVAFSLKTACIGEGRKAGEDRKNAMWIYGTDKHARVVADAVLEINPVGLSGFLSEVEGRAERFLDLPIACPSALRRNRAVHVAVVENDLRCRISERLTRAGQPIRRVVHPTASLSRQANVGDGSFLGAGSVIAPSTRIAEGVVIGHGAVVEIDSVIGAYCTIGPRAILEEGVTLEEDVIVGAGAIIRSGCRIGRGARIEAGQIVDRDFVFMRSRLTLKERIVA